MRKPHVFQKAPLVQEADPGVYWFCTCGRSKGQPVCDGSHKGTDFAPLKVELKERRRVAWCRCKHSQELPWCDGSHASLP